MVGAALVFTTVTINHPNRALTTLIIMTRNCDCRVPAVFGVTVNMAFFSVASATVGSDEATVYLSNESMSVICSRR